MNLGGYDRSDFNESTGNSVLENLLQSHSEMYGHFGKLDKTPNMDGYFDILKKEKRKSVPIGKIEVQIKTLDHDYSNTNIRDNCSKYKYSCDTKIFNVVKESITLNPCMLFMVDVKEKRVFYKYISLEYVLSLNITDEEKKTIYFGDEDEIDSVDAFYEKVKVIYENRKRELLDEKSSHFITNNNLTTDELTMLQDEFDYLNDVFNAELSFIKKRLFPDVWKFGLAYVKDERAIGIGIYWICKGRQGEYFKKLTIDAHKNCMFIHVNYKQDQDVRALINSFIKKVLEDAFKKCVFPLEYVKNEVLEEIAFYFLDKIASIEKTFENQEKPLAYYKDEEKTSVIEGFYTAMIQYGYEKYIQPPVSISLDSNAIFLSDPMEEINRGHSMNHNRSRLQYLLLHPEKRDEVRLNIWLRGKFAYAIIKEAIEELKNRKVDVVHRVWKPKDWNDFEKRRKSVGLFRIENGYTVEDYYDNLEKLIFKVPENYKFLIQNCPEFGEKLNCKKRYEFAFHKNEDFILHAAVFESEEFETKIEEELLDMSFTEQKENLFEKRGCLFFSTGGCDCIFSDDFPLLKNTYYVLMCQLMHKYNISDWEGKRKNYLFR